MYDDEGLHKETTPQLLDLQYIPLNTALLEHSIDAYINNCKGYRVYILKVMYIGI